MKLPQDAIIAEAKITRYLLQWKPEDDKSKFLSQAGYEMITAIATRKRHKKTNFTFKCCLY